MSLPEDFVFSQANLQDFVDCRRRFYYRYIQKLKWPAIQSEPFTENERLLHQGTIFHRAVHQFWLGIPPDVIASTLEDEEVITWWQNFIHFVKQPSGLLDAQVRKYPEFMLTTIVAGHFLAAKYDLITGLTDGSLHIFDWKTQRTQPNRKRLENRLQTIVYSFVAATAGAHLIPAPISSVQQVRLTYWFSAYPDEMITLSYNETEIQRAKTFLEDMIQLIVQLSDLEAIQSFPKTDHLQKCAFCEYRSLCDTGIKAGIASDEFLSEVQDAIEFDFDQITELLIG